MKRCNITDHAVEQFIRRWAPDKKASEAYEEIQSLYNTSKIVGKTRLGDTVVVSSHRPEIRLVIKDRDVCVTVLPPPDNEAPSDEIGMNIEDDIRRCEEKLTTIDEEYGALGKEKTRIHNIVLKIDSERVALTKEKERIMNKISMLRDRYYAYQIGLTK